jgi:YidB-like protein
LSGAVSRRENRSRALRLPTHSVERNLLLDAPSKKNARGMRGKYPCRKRGSILTRPISPRASNSSATGQTGLSRDDLLQGLSRYLPQVIDAMTPQGRLPTAHEAERLI